MKKSFFLLMMLFAFVSMAKAETEVVADCGSSVTITATAKEGYHFDHWQDGNTDNPRTIVVNEDATYTAEFMPIPYTIIVESADESQGTVQVEIN